MAKIVVENLCKTFNPHSRNANKVLKNVSFELPEKGLVAIFGKSGSGKTTLLNIIGGLDRQDGGKVYIDGVSLNGRADRVRNAKIGFIFQNYYLERGYTIAGIMRNAMLIAGFKDEKEIERRTEEALKLVDMQRYKNKQGDALSGGQKQRVAIARALIKGVDIILADEPTGNLDAENTVKVMEILKEISKTRLVVMVTHEVSLIKKYADSHIKIVDGELSQDGEIEQTAVYMAERKQINVEKSGKRITQEGLDIEFYGEPLEEGGKIRIISDSGSLYIMAGDGVEVIDSGSEKKVVFGGASQEEKPVNADAAKTFTPSGAKRNGKLFTFANVMHGLFHSGEESIYSTANLLKQVFVFIIAVVMCFLAFTVNEVINTTFDTKQLSEYSYYVNLNSYMSLRSLDKDVYSDLDFFETQYRSGGFAYDGMPALSNITAEYSPAKIESGETLDVIYGSMPEDGEVVISRALAEEIKSQLRIAELQNDRSVLAMTFDGEYPISGIVEYDEPCVYFNKADYVNFLGVYGSISFSDLNSILFSEEYASSAYTAEIRLYDGALGDSFVTVEINRNSLYRMMEDTTQADYLVQTANSYLKKFPYSVNIANSLMYVQSFSVTRSVMSTDIIIYVNANVLSDIFRYIKPSLDTVSTETYYGLTQEYYFCISADSENRLALLTSALSANNIVGVDVQAAYDEQNSEIIEDSVSSLYLFACIILLLYIIYYFVEKSGSIKNSKEYGVYRAIGVNKSNLLFKEVVRFCFTNLITYLLFFAVCAILMCVYYAVANVSCMAFILIAAGVFVFSALIMAGIALIPYLFVLWQTPAKILSGYDI